jgi:hypothetical protein
VDGRQDIRRAAQILQRKLEEQRFARQSRKPLLRDGRIVGRGCADRFVERWSDSRSVQ